MQKKLMAVAVAGALAVPAGAFAAASSVQISGRVTYEYGYSSQTDARQSTDIGDNPGGSNIKFKGTENLGGGLSAWFQCETSTDIRALDRAHFCSRNSAIGLKGAFGNIHAGKWDTPYKKAINAGIVGAEATGLLGMSWLRTGGSGGAQAQDFAGTGTQGGQRRNRWSRRESNLIMYESPKFTGAQVLAAFSTGNAGTAATNAANNAKPRVISFGLTYDNGPLEAGLAYEKHQDFGAFTDPQDFDDHSWGLGVSYAFGKFQVGGFFRKDTYETGVGAETKKKTYGIGADWRLPGPHMLSAQYVKADDSDGNGGSIGGLAGIVGCATAETGGTAVAPNCSGTGADAWSLGYTYRFSKRTTVRLGYVRQNPDHNNNRLRVGNIGGGLRPGEATSAYAMLWKHNY
jgi:predicted porin